MVLKDVSIEITPAHDSRAGQIVVRSHAGVEMHKASLEDVPKDVRNWLSALFEAQHVRLLNVLR